MNTTNCVQTHAPSHLREEFQEWLDSYEPNRLKELDIGPVASLLDALANCGDVLPAGYCDQLEIPKGSTYAEAVEEVREWYARPLTDDEKMSAVAAYRESETRHRTAEMAMSYLETHGLTIDQGWHLNGNPPPDVAEYLDGLIEGCFPTDEAELTQQVIEMISGDLP